LNSSPHKVHSAMRLDDFRFLINCSVSMKGKS